MHNFRYVTKREFLQGARRWSGAVATLAVTGEAVTAAAPVSPQWLNASWSNRYGGGWNNRGTAWANRGGSWVNRSGGGGWINRYGGGGIAWVNR